MKLINLLIIALSAASKIAAAADENNNKATVALRGTFNYAFNSIMVSNTEGQVAAPCSSDGDCSDGTIVRSVPATQAINTSPQTTSPAPSPGVGPSGWRRAPQYCTQPEGGCVLKYNRKVYNQKGGQCSPGCYCNFVNNRNRSRNGGQPAYMCSSNHMDDSEDVHGEDDVELA